GVVAGLDDAAGVEQENAAADGGELAIQLEVFEGGVLGEDGFEKLAKAGDVERAAGEFDEAVADGGFRGLPEGLVEGAVGRDDAQIAIQDEERLPLGFKDVADVVELFADVALLLVALGDIAEDEHRA